MKSNHFQAAIPGVEFERLYLTPSWRIHHSHFTIPSNSCTKIHKSYFTALKLVSATSRWARFSLLTCWRTKHTLCKQACLFNLNLIGIFYRMTGWLCSLIMVKWSTTTDPFRPGISCPYWWVVVTAQGFNSLDHSAVFIAAIHGGVGILPGRHFQSQVFAPSMKNPPITSDVTQLL